MESCKLNVEHDTHIHLENKKVSRHYFLFLMIMYAVVYMTKNCFNAALADIKAEGIFTASEAGLITAVFYLVYTPLQIVGGFVADKYSPELMVKIGLIGGAVANAIIFLNQNYYVMLVVWTLNAVVQFALWPSTYKIITSQLCRSDRSYMIFFISMASTFGLLFSYVSAALLPSWEYNFALSAALLMILAVVMHFLDGNLNKFVKPDSEPIMDNKSAVKGYSGSTLSLFVKSGFIILLVPIIVRCIVGQASKTMAPLMMLELFGTDASVGNLLNTFIIISGLAGTLMVKLVLYPRIIKNELLGFLVMMSATLAAAIALIFVPNVTMTVIVLCVLSMFATAATLFASYFYATYTKYGKNGTAAGIGNAAASFGIVLLNYVFVKLSEVFDWTAVRIIWASLVALAVVLILVVILINRRFLSKESQKFSPNNE